ncbi:unnamed protein product [Schistosoma margrebowiei]|uniref:Uncharacterized protein n=1 Tax=Schistosoma margrebowiei TaxID=48269 RepID=A0A3P8CI11_9TREM|nr:unnamed protein product [Schistosoma margrebowiei]
MSPFDLSSLGRIVESLVLRFIVAVLSLDSCHVERLAAIGVLGREDCSNGLISVFVVIFSSGRCLFLSSL